MLNSRIATPVISTSEHRDDATLEHLARLDLETDPADSLHLAEDLDEVADDDRGG
jgi:hypothetical protein